MQADNQPNATNSEELVTLATHDRIILLCYYSVTILLSTIGNILVLLGILLSKPNRRKLQNNYLVTLSISNLFLGIVAGLSYIISLAYTTIEQPTNARNDICKGVLFVIYSMAGVGLLTVTAMSADRYFAIRYPYSYNKHFNKRIVIFINVYVWLQASITHLPAIIKEDVVKYDARPGLPCGSKWRNLGVVYMAVVSSLNTIIPAIIVLFTNIYVFLIAREHSRRAHNVGCISRNECQRNGDILRSSNLPEGRFPASTNTKKTARMNNSDSTVTARINDCFQMKSKPHSSNEANLEDKNSIVLPQDILDKRREDDARASIRKEKARQERKISLSTLILVITFWATWLPFVTLSLLIAFAGMTPSWTTVLYMTTFTTLSATWTPYIILATRKEIRNPLLTNRFTRRT